MTHQDHPIQTAPPIGRSANPRRGAWQRGLGRAEMAILLLLAALPPAALWSPVILGGGATAI